MCFGLMTAFGGAICERLVRITDRAEPAASRRVSPCGCGRIGAAVNVNQFFLLFLIVSIRLNGPKCIAW